MKPDQILTLIIKRLSKLAEDFPEFTGEECAEILRAEIHCLESMKESFTR